MFFKVVWKTALFGVSVFALLLTMGFGHGNDAENKNWGFFSEQAKVAKPGARVDGFRSVSGPAEPEMGFFDTVRYTLESWVGGGEMISSDPPPPRGTELQKLQNRSQREKPNLAVVNML